MYLNEHFQGEPLYNLAATTLSARLRLIFSVIKAGTKEYFRFCPERRECCASFLLSITESFRCAIQKAYFRKKICNLVLSKLSKGPKMSRIEHRGK